MFLHDKIKPERNPKLELQARQDQQNGCRNFYRKSIVMADL